jgi:hypothetical protein
MTHHMTDTELREWADLFPNFSPALALKRLLAERDDLQRQLMTAAERIAVQSEMLARAAERRAAYESGT